MATQPKHRFELIVCTIGRPAKLRELFDSLGCQACGNFRVIVVDQSRAEESAAVVDAFQDRFPILHIRDAGRGAARARNIGLRAVVADGASDANFVAFPDDDCTYRPDTLAHVARLFGTRPDWDIVCGFVCDQQGRESLRFDRHAGIVTPYNLFRRSMESSMFLRMECARGVWFDESFGVGTVYGSDEGADFLLQHLERGACIQYLPDLVVHHPAMAAIDREAVAKCGYYALGRGRLFRKHRFPWWFVGYSLARTSCGALAALLLLRPMKARFYAARLRGVLRGYFSREDGQGPASQGLCSG